MGHDFDIAIVGGGAAGLAAASVAAIAGFRAILFAPPAEIAEGRTAALLHGSIGLLSDIDAWPALSRYAAPLSAIRLIDASRRLIRAPEVTFYASEIGLPAFGYNIPNTRLVAGLRRHAQSFSSLSVHEAAAEAIVPSADHVRIESGGRAYGVKLVVAADGARSAAREAARIKVRRWNYPQAALVATFTIRHPHGGISTEFHAENGPFTLVPLPGDRVSLVWMDDPGTLEEAMHLPPERFSRLAEKRAGSIHGAMQVDSRPALFPLSAALAERFGAARTMLVGEAAHLFPPVGAQGLNLGLRDVAALRRVLGRHRSDPGAPSAVRDYHAAREADVRSRTMAVDLLNRSLLSDFLPVQALRGAGLQLAGSIPLIRKMLMRQGLAIDALSARR